MTPLGVVSKGQARPLSNTHQRREAGLKAAPFPWPLWPYPGKKGRSSPPPPPPPRLQKRWVCCPRDRVRSREDSGPISSQGKLRPQDSKCSWLHGQASPLEPRAGRAQLRRESQAEGEGRRGTGKGFPSPTPQHLPPLSTPPHRPGYESKTNRALGLRRGGEVPKKEIKRQRVEPERELRAARRRRGPSGRGQRTPRRGDRSGGAEGRDAGARLQQSGAWLPGPACAPSPGPTWLRPGPRPRPQPAAPGPPPHLMEGEELLLELLALRVCALPAEPKLHHLAPGRPPPPAGCAARPRRS